MSLRCNFSDFLSSFPFTTHVLEGHTYDTLTAHEAQLVNVGFTLLYFYPHLHAWRKMCPSVFIHNVPEVSNYANKLQTYIFLVIIHYYFVM